MAYNAQADVFYHLRVDSRFLPLGQHLIHISEKLSKAYLHDLLEQLEDNAIKRRILQSTLPSLGQRRPNGKRNNNIIGIFRCAIPSSISLGLQKWGLRSYLTLCQEGYCRV